MDFRSAGVIAMLLIGLAGPGCQAFGGAAARNREVSLTPNSVLQKPHSTWNPQCLANRQRGTLRTPLGGPNS